jgi:hypothetical protein
MHGIMQKQVFNIRSTVFIFLQIAAYLTQTILQTADKTLLKVGIHLTWM